MVSAGPSEINHLFCLPNMKRQIVVLVPVYQLLHLLSVQHIFIIADEPHDSGVLGELDVVCSEAGGAVVGQQSEQQWAQRTPLESTGAQHGCVGVGTADLDCLGPFNEEIQNLVPEGGVEPQQVKLSNQLLKDDSAAC